MKWAGEPIYDCPDCGQHTTAQSLDRAIADFDSALVYATAAASTAQERLARVGKARAQVNQGDYAAAAATIGGAAGVPTSFVYRLNHSITTPRQENSLHWIQFQSRALSLAHNEGATGLGFRARDGSGAGANVALGDPRVLWSRTAGRVALDGSSPLFDQLKYPARTSPTPLADGVEARLIEAEYQLSLGDAAGWLATLNGLRTTVTGLAPLTDPGTTAARVDLHFRERAFWLFATAHRLGDMRRLVRQYGRGAETVYPTGAYFKGGSVYGGDVNLPIPVEEENNPQYRGCVDRAACVLAGVLGPPGSRPRERLGAAKRPRDPAANGWTPPQASWTVHSPSSTLGGPIEIPMRKFLCGRLKFLCGRQAERRNPGISSGARRG